MTLTYPISMQATLMLCDSVESQGGKLYILGGGWSSITAGSIPTVHPRLGIAAMIQVPWTETDKLHAFRISLQNEDGRAIPFGSDPTATEGFIAAQFNVGRPPTIQAGDAQNVPVAINVDRQLFTSPGTYNLVMEIDGEEVARLPFRVHSMADFRAAGS